MIKTILIFICSLISFTLLNAQEPLIQNIQGREILKLNGSWQYIVDPYETGYYDYRNKPFDKSENQDKPNPSAFYSNYHANDKTERVEYDFDKSDVIYVPGDWNSQKEKLFYYEGTLWYKKSFDYKKQENENRVFVHFGAANYRTDVYLNGRKLGVHIGGFTPFNFEITNLLKDEDNFLVVRVNNKRIRDGVPTINTDWWNYGGITRDVKIIEVPPVFIRDYSVRFKKDNLITGSVLLDGDNNSGKEIEISIPELNLHKKYTSNENGEVQFEFKADKINLWSPDNPYLYDVTFRTEQEQVSDKTGFRIIETSGTDILLNGKPVFLKGISIHEENPLRGGRAFSEDDARLLLNWAKELGCNFVRLAHYPHNENMPRLADEMGILVWEEIPVYWTISFDNEETFKNASNQLSEVISRDKNRASVIIWSMANETPVNDVRTDFLKRLAETARGLDNTRLISAALEQRSKGENHNTRYIEDPFMEYVDVVSFNEYIGWYDGLPDKCSKIKWELDYNKPIIISEFGAGAKAGYHGDKLTRWSEEFQEYLYEETISMLKKIPQLRGTTPWILVDFRSPRRPLPEIQDGWNRKGLISSTGEKKKAFYVLQKYYQSLNEIERK